MEGEDVNDKEKEKKKKRKRRPRPEEEQRKIKDTCSRSLNFCLILFPNVQGLKTVMI